MTLRTKIQTALAVLIVAFVAVVVWVERKVVVGPTGPSRDLIALAKNIYYEAALANEPEDGLHLVAHTTMRRAQMNRPSFGGTSIYDVVYKRSLNVRGVMVCQYSWTCDHTHDNVPPTFACLKPQSAEGPPCSAKEIEQDQSRKRRWEASLAVGDTHLAGKYTVPDAFRDAVFYLNAEVVKKRWPHNYCNFVTRLVEVGKIHPQSKHDAFREPRNNEEREALPKRADVPECKPPVSKKGKTKAKTVAKK